jgi:ArsR family metal-binding transcriptional regulator
VDSERVCAGFALKRVLDCIADPTKNRATAAFLNDVSPAFPYLNAVLPDIQYGTASKLAAPCFARIDVEQLRASVPAFWREANASQ